MNESLVFNFDSETSTKAAIAALAWHGLYAVRSFDLRSALDAHGGCECPHHGTAQCNCQFVVLLIYHERPLGGEVSLQDRHAVEPLVLTMHSRDTVTDARIVHDATTIPEPHLTEQVIAALVEAVLTLQATQSPVAEVTTDGR